MSIKIENVVLPSPAQMEAVIRGMRNPLNSWHLSDSYITHIENPETLNTADFQFVLGEKDETLMRNLAKAGSVHGKYLRMMDVILDITAPLYWWKEFDTYKVGTVANSCSTMHKIADKEFTLDDFSCEHLLSFTSEGDERKIPFVDVSPYADGNIVFSSKGVLECIIIPILNSCRDRFLESKDKKYWWQMIQLLPSSYNQRRTVMLNYEVLRGIYIYRKDHKLTEWVELTKWIETLPYSYLITGEEN